MAQADGVVANGTGSAVRSDINNQYAALWSNHSGSTEPSSGKVAYQTWADTNSGYLKIRNAANNAWIQLFKLDGTDLADICRLTGSTNNTVCTVTGANAIQGESNVQIDGSGRLLIGTTTEGEVSADDLTVASSGNTGITIRSGTTNTGNIFFSDGTSGNDEIRGYIQYKQSNEYFNIGVNATTKLRVDGDGLKFGSDTAAVNALDDYEEGTFTPYMRGTGGSVGTYAQFNLSGTYTKIGNVVYFSLQSVLSNKGSYSGDFKWGGLPFTARSGDSYSVSMDMYPSSNTDAAMRAARVQNGQDFGYVMSGSRLDIPAPYSEIETGYYLRVSGCYQAA